MTVDSIRALLKSRDTRQRVRAVEQLDPADPEHVPLLLATLRDASHYVAAQAAKRLVEAPPEDAAAAILERFADLMRTGTAADPGCAIREQLALALGRLRYHPALEALRAAMKTVQIEPVAGVPTDTAVAMRGNCALALSQLWSQDAARDIGILLFDMGNRLPDDTAAARRAAARALGLLGDPAALVPLAIRLAHPKGEVPEVLADCMEAVAALEDPRALELLEPYLRGGDRYLAAQAALALARIRHPRAPELLRDLCHRLDGDALRAVVLALGAMRTDEAVAAVHALARSDRDAIRAATAEALALSSDDASRSLLQALADSDASPAVRKAAARALGKAD
jgi:HEAT repeat protein